MGEIVWWQAILLGLIQGLTEFLPVSSSGHLLLTRQLMGLGDIPPAFDIMLHIGTLVAVLICLRKDVADVFVHPKKILFLIIATIPAVITGFLLKDWIEDVFYDGSFLWITFLMTAVILLACEIIEKVRENKKKPLMDVGYVSSVSMGLMQAVALFPGLSRSGCTIFGGVAVGAKREQVASFSFLMSIPVILGGAVLSIGDLDFSIWPMMLLGMLFSFLGGMFAVKLMLRLISKANYKWFSLYLVAASIFSLVMFTL